MKRRQLRVAIIGAGRAGLGLARALRRSRMGSVAVLSRSESPAEWSRVIARANVILVCVPDDSIPLVVRRLAGHDLGARTLLHTSGSAPLSSFAPLRSMGTETGVLHPLISFPPVRGGGARRIDLAGITFSIEGTARARSDAATLARRMGGSPIRVPESRRAAWHLAATMVSNGLVALIGSGLDLASRRAGLSEQQARRAFLPLARISLDNVARLGSRRALTGPVSRGDRATVARHIAALARESAAVRHLYATLSSSMIDLAMADGRLSAKDGRAMRRILRSSLTHSDTIA